MEKYVVGYARTSTDLQSNGLQSQVRALETHFKASFITGYRIFADEGISGTKASRPELDKLIQSVKRGEVSAVVVYSFSRFARSTKHLLEALELFETHGTAFISISENLDTRTSVGKFVFTILAALSAMEREILVDRVKSGLVNAKSKGKKLGRKQTRPSELIQNLRSQGFSYRQISKLAKCSVSTVAEELNFTKRSEIEDTERARSFG